MHFLHTHAKNPQKRTKIKKNKKKNNNKQTNKKTKQKNNNKTTTTTTTKKKKKKKRKKKKRKKKKKWLLDPFGFESRIWDMTVSVPDHCLSFYFFYADTEKKKKKKKKKKKSYLTKACAIFQRYLNSIAHCLNSTFWRMTPYSGSILMCVIASANIISGYCLS